MTEVACSKDCAGRHCMRVARAGVVYRCPQALADALGIKRQSVYQSLHRHGHAEKCGIKKGIVPGSGKINHRKPVAVGPHQWPSISHMARDLGVGRRQLGINLRYHPERVLALVMREKG